MHPSTDLDSTRLIDRSSNHDPAEEERKRYNLADMRHDANVESKILLQLENFGIPWHDVRCQKSEKITHSARYKHGLKGYFNH